MFDIHKAWFPQPLYDALNQESDDSGRTVTEIMREAIAERYQRQAQEAGRDVVIDAIGFNTMVT